MSSIFLADVLDQPHAMRMAMTHYAGYEVQMAQIAALKPRQVLFTGMGSSHYCSQSAVILLNQGGIPARVEAASEILHYEMGAITPDCLLVLTSQSGESGEVVDLINRISPEQTVIGITNNPDSTLGRRADICLEMHVEPEIAVSTRTYLASLILTDMLCAALLGKNPMVALEECGQAVDALALFLQEHEQLQHEMADFLGHPATLCYIGRGHAIATAECGALFTRETAKYPALAFDSGEFRHGPYEMVDADFRAIIFAPSGATLQLQKNLTEAIIQHTGKVVFVTDVDVDFGSDLVHVVHHSSVDERYSPLVQVVIPQLFANDMALHRGYAPGVFRQSSKITTAQ